MHPVRTTVACSGQEDFVRRVKLQVRVTQRATCGKSERAQSCAAMKAPEAARSTSPWSAIGSAIGDATSTSSTSRPTRAKLGSRN